MRVPVAALALEATDSEPGTLQAEVASTMAICGSIITNLAFTTLAGWSAPPLWPCCPPSSPTP